MTISLLNIPKYSEEYSEESHFVNHLASCFHMYEKQIVSLPWSILLLCENCLSESQLKSSIHFYCLWKEADMALYTVCLTHLLPWANHCYSEQKITLLKINICVEMECFLQHVIWTKVSCINSKCLRQNSLFVGKGMFKIFYWKYLKLFSKVFTKLNFRH